MVATCAAEAPSLTPAAREAILKVLLRCTTSLSPFLITPLFICRILSTVTPPCDCGCCYKNCATSQAVELGLQCLQMTPAVPINRTNSRMTNVKTPATHTHTCFLHPLAALPPASSSSLWWLSPARLLLTGYHSFSLFALFAPFSSPEFAFFSLFPTNT